jgi:hypothetical protein
MSIENFLSEFSKGPIFEVVSPVPSASVKLTPLAHRKPNLNRRTICEVTGGFRADETFPIIRQLLKERFPEAKFVTFEKIEGADIQAQAPSLRLESLKALTDDFLKNGCDAVISGNGH